MNSIKVCKNGISIFTIGAANAQMLVAEVSIRVGGPELGSLYLAGMNNLGNNRSSHTSWVASEPLVSGDEISLQYIDSVSVTPPIKEVASDSKQHLAEQKKYKKSIKEKPLVVKNIDRVFPNALLQAKFQNEMPIFATFEGGREFISLLVNWNKWESEICNVHLSSFSQKDAIERNGAKVWFKGYFHLGDLATLKLEANQGAARDASHP